MKAKLFKLVLVSSFLFFFPFFFLSFFLYSSSHSNNSIKSPFQKISFSKNLLKIFRVELPPWKTQRQKMSTSRNYFFRIKSRCSVASHVHVQWLHHNRNNIHFLVVQNTSSTSLHTYSISAKFHHCTKLSGL